MNDSHRQQPPLRNGKRESGSRTSEGASAQFSEREKLRLFLSLFRGRTDVYPVRWENLKKNTSGYMPECSNKFVRPLCNIEKVKCGQCENQAFKPFDERAIEHHLRRLHTIGIYPLLASNSCWFLVLDFDKKNWGKDVSSVRATCKSLGIQAYVELSRSGAGAHLWIFLSEATPATQVRALGRLILALTCENSRSPGLESFDRMFPGQDTVPEGGFGNLIALPLQKKPRSRGHSVFLDENLNPYPDQWRTLEGIERVSPNHIAKTLKEHSSRHFTSENAKQTTKSLGHGKRERKNKILERPSDGKIIAYIRDRIYVESKDLPPNLAAKIRDLAMFSNPEFFRRKAARISTWNVPRVIRCAEVMDNQITLPRGCAPALAALCSDLKLNLSLVDQREEGSSFPLSFSGTLSVVQSEALTCALEHEHGILVLPTGVGKTVVACATIAKRSVSTLVLVHRRPLLEQWRKQLFQFLDIPESGIGELSSKRNRTTAKLDIAMVQSLARGDFQEALSRYGQVVVDECHHAAARNFEQVLSQLPARYLLGLTATPKRRDGHHPIMHMELGPIIFQFSAKKAAEQRPFSHWYFVRQTALADSEEPESLSDLQARLSLEYSRNSLILDDAIAAIRDDRSPLILCQRRDHVLWFAENLARHFPNLVVLMGGRKEKERKASSEQLKNLSPEAQRVIVATGSFIGEGFDDPRLDTLLLASPISWKGLLAQYAGRLHRLHSSKREVWIFDYVDEEVPTLGKMFQKRASGYRSLGYQEGTPPDEFELLCDPSWEAELYWEAVQFAE